MQGKLASAEDDTKAQLAIQAVRAELQEIIDALQKELKEQKEQKEQMSEEKESMVQAMLAATSRVSDIEKELGANNQEMAACKSTEDEVQQLKRQVDEKSKLVEDLRLELIAASKDRDTMRGDRELEMDQMSELRQELQALRDETERLQVQWKAVGWV